MWALDCADFPVPKGDRSVVSNALRHDGLQFIQDHLSRLPVVIAVREAATLAQQLPRERQRAVERAELVVHRDPDRLEHALGGMPAAEAARRRARRP